MEKFEVYPKCKEAVWKEGKLCVTSSMWSLSDLSGFPGIASRFARLFELPMTPRKKTFTILCNKNLADEEYHLEMASDRIEVSASGEWGFLRALSTLTQLRDGPYLPLGRVHDWPRLKIRGIHIMFECFRQMGFAEAMQLLNSATRLKLNTILLEFGDRFPFQGRHKDIAALSALTRDEIRELLAFARDNGLCAIPLLQSLGHLNYVLKHDEYAAFREEDCDREQLCPSNEQSFQLFTELAEDILSLFGEIKFMHIGGDETRHLGCCPRCREKMEKTSKGALYAGHINRICEWLVEKGITPLVWDDILCANPEVLDGLHPAAWIVYWDYWTTSSPSPLLVGRYDHGERATVVYDEQWNGKWKGELSTVEERTLAAYASPVKLEKQLSKEYLRVYGHCLGSQLPKFARAFPYLEHYQQKGRKVIGAPTCSGNHSTWYGLPDFPRYGENIHCFAERCIEAKSAGLITTAWYNRTPEILIPGLISTAEFTW